MKYYHKNKGMNRDKDSWYNPSAYGALPHSDL